MNSLLSTVGEEGGKGRSSVNVNVQEGREGEEGGVKGGGSGNWAKLSRQSAQQSFCPD